MHCHGVTGDGRGPTGPWVNPHPPTIARGCSSSSPPMQMAASRAARTFAAFSNAVSKARPCRPSVSWKKKEKEQLISYVIHLSLRGQVEMSIMRNLLKKEALEGSIAESVKDFTETFLKQWFASSQKVIEPSSFPYKDGNEQQLQASVRRGYELFTDPKGAGSCIACHVDFGRQARVPLRRMGFAGSTRQPDGWRLSRRPSACRSVLDQGRYSALRHARCRPQDREGQQG